ncbi:AAA domain-containing protein [Portibacter lacus]|uniref:AAA family ATPase n=1 Tax=Portibacter lacus TaxID=1099794 RepID=A0AA37WGR8_9BACT|nr:ATP-binding protein [Portibacter lacus]GLR20173.1 hypothetical protein GCM10007940_47890 [Portibacter lacus]
MSNISNILNFYKDCYAFDYQSVCIRNFFGREAQYVNVIADLSPISEKNKEILVEARWGQKVLKDLAIHGKEKALYAGALFLLGSSKQLGRKIRVAPPLYLYEASLVDHFGNHRVSIDVDGAIINPYFLEYLKSLYPNVDISYEDFASTLPTGILGIAEIIQIETTLKTHFPLLDCSHLNKWYVPHAKLENARFCYKQNNPNDFNRLICGVSLAIIKKQEGSRGVINELDELAKRNITDNTLNELFSEGKRYQKSSIPLSVDVPIPLSERQKEVFYNVSQENISLVIGPPGTGKSYTISALTTELIGKGQSVLIASKNSQAGSVISKKIENDVRIKGVVIKAARKSYKYHLSNRIDNILSGIQRKNPPSKEDLSIIGRNITQYSRSIEKLIKQLQLQEKTEHEWGLFFKEYQNGFFEKFKKKWIEYRHQNLKKIWHLKDEIDDLVSRKNKLVRKYIKLNYDYTLSETLKRFRRDIQNFSKTLNTSEGKVIQKHFENTNFKNVLKAIPAWIINCSDAHHILPLESEIFDVLIIDEATQCDIASCLPLIYRAKKIVIIGDPKQLRHISFLSNARQEILNQQYELNGMKYRNYSILDLVSDLIPSQTQITFLNEHFRSFPDIISFSNSKFYNNSLHLMTATPITNILKHLYIHHVSGVRNTKGENLAEANAIIKKMLSVVEKEVDLDADLSSKIGIISPFRAQVSLLKSLIRETFSLEQIKKHDLLIGTPYHFQGEERDIMLISFTLDASSHSGAFNYLNKADVFNVSITRARSLQIIYTSLQHAEVNEQSLLHEYLLHIEKIRTPKKLQSGADDHDEFTQEIIQHITNWGVDRIYTTYAISGVIIDLVIVQNGKTLCIDLIGYPGEYQEMFSQNQLNMLDRMGHKVFFLPYSEWKLNYEQTLESLHKFIFS